MKKNYFKILMIISMAALPFNMVLYSQETSPKPPQQPTTPQAPAGFDVIIKLNGEFIYGLVKEVGQEFIKYQRTDIPDGPIYMVARSEVYAISYRNQLREVINPSPNFPVTEKPKPIVETIKRDTIYLKPDPIPIPIPIPPEKEKEKLPIQYKNGNVLFALGFIRGFSKVENADNYSSSTTFPNLSLAYEVKKSDNLRFGLQMAVGTHKFSRQEYSAYDSATNDIVLKESIFTLHLYGKYFLKGFKGSLHPYFMGGLGIQSSYVKSEYKLQFINNANQSIIAKSGARSVGLSALLRAGANYQLNDQFQAFADVGIGPTVIQIGIAYKLEQIKKK